MGEIATERERGGGGEADRVELRQREISRFHEGKDGERKTDRKTK